MPDPIIKVNNLSKRYRIGAKEQGYKTFREAIVDSISAPVRNLAKLRRLTEFKDNPSSNDEEDVIWALKDVSFEVNEGEVLGIIGRNGAGKSTLLKILSRITEPTSGSIEINGRVSSLLEVGTGFHPELTGRENIFLNGAILGMRKWEIEKKFDEIVKFSEIEKFIDTPVKRYSSGMYVRLAFAVAAHLEPEILVVDEVLAVGDAAFQKKCLNKMQDVGHEGRTVLFVSHNMSAITRLCQRTILLDEGRILKDGPSHQVVNAYLQSGIGTTAVREWNDITKAPGNDIVRLCAVRVRTEDGRVTDAVDIRRPIGIEMEYEVLKSDHVLVSIFHFYNEEGVYAFGAADYDPIWRRRPRPTGHYLTTAWIPGNFLSEGTMIVHAAIARPDTVTHLHEQDVVAFQVIDSFDGDSARGDYAGHMPGVVRPLLRWKTQFNENCNNASTCFGSKIEYK